MSPRRSKSTLPHDSAAAPRTIAWGYVWKGMLLLAAFSLAGAALADWWTTIPDDKVRQATYVGRHTCAECHQQQHSDWIGSHHDLAMDLATDQSVLGDFDNATVEHHGIESRMFRDGRRFMIHTEGPDGEMADFEIKYVFGVTPLQQYMVEFDRPAEMPEHEISRVQVLRISWDTLKKRWFYLPPPDVDAKLAPTDDLHWTGIAQRWNNMCADCHSTNLRKNFDVATARYHTTFSEIDVSCEACHGPGSAHVELARERVLFWDRKYRYGLAELKSADAKVEIETCAACHSRRRVVYPGYRPGQPYHDYYANEVLQPLTYHADGQILDEVYVYGSFLQSKMYHKGIRCTDCHDPHTARLKHEGNKVCTSCHQHNPGVYDSVAHHKHPLNSSGASCVECHMPHATYMEVDPRRDHSLRVPRPDLSVRLGTPNACTGCHLNEAELPAEKREGFKQYHDWIRAARGGDQQVAEALRKLDQKFADAVDQWYPHTERQPHFATELAPTWRGARDTDDELLRLARAKSQPAIVRATALFHVQQAVDEQAIRTARSLLEDPSAQVRAQAAALLEFSDLPTMQEHLIPLLDDEIRLVRSEAARVLTRYPYSRFTGSQRRLFDAAFAEYKAGLLESGDRAAAHTMLATLAENQRRAADARAAYETAIRIEPTATGPRTNLAAWHDRQAEPLEQQRMQAVASRDAETAQRLLKAAAEHRIEAARLRREEFDLLARDVRLAPDNAAIQYRYGLSLYLHEDFAAAEAALLKAAQLEPDVAEFALALALFYEKLQRWNEAVRWARKTLELGPENEPNQRVLQRIEQSAIRWGPAPP